MKCILSLLFFMAVFINLYGEDLTVVSVKADDATNIALEYPRYDLNQELTGVLIIQGLDPNEFSIRGNIVGEVIKENGICIVYLIEFTKKITIYSDIAIPLEINLGDYEDLKKGVMGGKTYRLILDKTKIRKDYGPGSNILMFKSDTPFSELIVNGASWSISNGTTSKQLVPFGEYEYKAFAEGYEPIEDFVIVKESLGSKIIHLNFEKE